MKKLLMALLLASTALAQGAEVKGSGKSVDVMKFDVRGIKLGMGQEEALKIIKEKFPDGKINEIKASDDTSIKIYGKIFNFAVEVGNETEKNGKLIVFFAPNALENKPNELVVSGVSYQLSGNEDNFSKLKKSAVEKFGTPVLIDSKDSYYWCYLDSKKECNLDNKPFISVQNLEKYIDLTLINGEFYEAIYKAAETNKKEEKIEL